MPIFIWRSSESLRIRIFQKFWNKFWTWDSMAMDQCSHMSWQKCLCNFCTFLNEIMKWKSCSLGQFHQHFTNGFFVRKFRAKLFCACSKGSTFYCCKKSGTNALIKCWWNWILVLQMHVKNHILITGERKKQDRVE